MKLRSPVRRASECIWRLPVQHLKDSRFQAPEDVCWGEQLDDISTAYHRLLLHQIRQQTVMRMDMKLCCYAISM